MGRVTMNAAVSLDGFIAYDDNTIGPSFDWHFNGDEPFTFVGSVREGVEKAREYAGDRGVSLTAGDIGGQALRAGLVDRVVLNLVPALLGAGRPFFGSGGVLEDPILLENPIHVVEGDRVVHLAYDVRR